MDTLQNPTQSKTDENKIANGVGLTPIAIHGNTYVDFVAVQGMITQEDGEIKRLTATEFASKIGVTRDTLYDWQKRIPDFWGRVAERRKELGGRNRIMKVYNGLYLKAAAGNPQAATIWLANHDPDFRMPTQPVKHDASDALIELLNSAREHRRGDNQIQEGEVIDGPGDTDTRTS